MATADTSDAQRELQTENTAAVAMATSETDSHSVSESEPSAETGGTAPADPARDDVHMNEDSIGQNVDTQEGPAHLTEQTEQEEEADDGGFQPARPRRRPRRTAATIFTAEEIERAVANPITNHQMNQLRAFRDSKMALLRNETDTEVIQSIEWSIWLFNRVINLELQARRRRPARAARRQP